MDIRKHWWKILASLLLLYTILAGFLIPLKPGVEHVSPDAAMAGTTVTMRVQGYNASYTQATELRAWLKLDSTRVMAAAAIRPQSPNRLELDFDIPLHLPVNPPVDFTPGKDTLSTELTLVLDNEIDGYSLLPAALTVLDPVPDSLAGDTLWQNSPLANIHQTEGITFPYRNILYETIRNLYFHVPLWFGMLIILLVSAIYSVKYLRKGQRRHDQMALAFTQVGILYGILGLLTGAVWAKWTWGEWWSFDVKQNASAIAMLIYLAYMVLRTSFDDYEKQARISAVYNIFAFNMLIPLLFVLPRLYDSLHPGNGGNPGLGSDDLDNTMRMVFYPAIIGWTLLGVWLAQISFRLMRIREAWLERWS